MDGVAFQDSTAVKRVVTERDNAGFGMLGEILLQPCILGRAGGTAPQARCGAICVQRNDVPDSEIKAVVTPFRRSRLYAPIVEIGRAVFRTVELVIAGRWVRSILEASPGFVVAILELLGRTLFIPQVACWENLAGNVLDQFCRRFRAFQRFTGSDIASAH